MIETLLPEGMSQGTLLALVLASYISSFISGSLGIGGGGLLLAVMATLVPASALIPVHGVVQLGSNAGRALLLLGKVHRPALPAFAVGSLVGAVSGGLVAIDLPEAAIQIGIGCFVIWTVVARPPKWLSEKALVSGIVSSFLTMLFGATGLFVASYTKAFRLPRHAHVATHAALMTLQHGLKVVVFAGLGFAFSNWAGLIVLMLLAGFAGTWTGGHVLNRIDDRRFGLGLNALLVLISLRLIWQGLGDMF